MENPMVTFVLNLFGVWSKVENSGEIKYDCYDSSEIQDNLGNMTFERIMSEFESSESCFMSKPRAVYAYDDDYRLDKGLILIRDQRHCAKVLDYLEILGQGEIQFFADFEKIPMPSFTPLSLFTEEELDTLYGTGPEGLKQTKDGVDLGASGTDTTVGDRVLDSLVIDNEGRDNDRDECRDEGRDNDRDERVISDEVRDEAVDMEAEVDESDSEIEEGRDNDIDEGVISDDDSSVYSAHLSESEVDEQEVEQVMATVEDGEEGRFQLGQTFAGAKEAREAINSYGVKFGYKIKFVKNEKTRVRVICMNEKECPFVMHVSKDGDADGLVIKTLILEHTCCKQREVPSATQGYLAKYFKQAVYRNPKYTSKDMQGHVKDHLKLHVSLAKCKRAKKEIICKLEGSYKEEFSRLCGYIEKVNECMPGSRLELQLSTEHLQAGKRVFKRLFVMLEPCRLNWLGGCRKLISLDGCHLKGVTFGCLLTAVGKDGNEGIVPIAWAVVNKENKNNWRWFMNWLKQGLELGEGDEVTIMSDMQKGLMEAVKEITPQAEHRWCARHIYANWSKK
ncbi:uncharacterized protein LOC131012472 isoform X1 [Salvia miltiorrhiza]|uniref:uncharacterized protein LOC131012472 isoform X1 n=1 Tax=Salvia miltiorrhiza TaxID=226208 RepID=UPI0025ABEADA|nr:uncharacterized protein LOC131012472 isoform X1 [Salvia miltiorrhiza]XP_057796414.1 uncharacterized protein LOC131012472 isoform X1 [Salvia miltiorrhiza]